MLNPEQDAQTIPDSQALAGVARWVDEWDDVVKRIDATEGLLSALKARKQKLEQEVGPAARFEAVVSGFRATRGRVVNIETVCQGNIPADTTIQKAKGEEREALLQRRQLGLAHVRQYWPGLIKTELSLSLPKGEAEVALRIAALIRNQFQLNPSVAESIHHATLNSHFKELLTMGRVGDIPIDTFALYVGPLAKIK